MRTYKLLNIKLSCRSLIAVLLVFLILCCCFSVFGQGDAAVEGRLESANSAFNEAFNAVLSAESAGADVSGLLEQLNVAANSLASAQVAYRLGDFDKVNTFLEGVESTTSQIKTEAILLKESAQNEAQAVLWSAIGISIVGTIIFVVVLFYLWRWFKRRYVSGLLNAKPEVVEE